MDLRPSLPLRSPLASLNSNGQRDQDEIDTTLFSPGGGTTTRAGSLKLRKLFERPEEDEPCNIIQIASSSTFATSSSGGGDFRTDTCENGDGFGSGSGSGSHYKPNTCENRVERKKKAVPKKIKSKSKSKSKLPKKRTSIGRWETWERFEFLRGLRCHGRGHWKKIGERIPSRTTIQVKTHAQVMLRKQETGFNIFEELDEYDNANANVEREANPKLASSSLPLPKPIKEEKKTDKKSRCEQSRSSNTTRRRVQRSAHRRPRHSFPLSNKAEKDFQPGPLTVPSPFQPVTTTTVTTTMVGNHNHHHPFHHQGRHHYGSRHYDHNQNHNQHHHPYQYTPSFDSIATAASVAAAAAASSSLFPTAQPHFQPRNSAFQASMAAAANQGSNLRQDFFLPSISARSNSVLPNFATQNNENGRISTSLFDAEVEAVEALLGFRAASENGPASNKNRTRSI